MKKGCLVQMGVLVLGLLIASPKGWADDDNSQLKQQVQALQARVDQLESQLVHQQQVVVPPPMPVYNQWNDPFAQMARMRAQMDHNIFNPRMGMKQTDKQYVITMDLPGMDKDKIDVEVKGGMLVVSGERKSESEDNQNGQNNQYYTQQSSFGSFMQAIPLPADAKRDKIEAKYKNGVLIVTVDRVKKEEKKPESEKITVS